MGSIPYEAWGASTAPGMKHRIQIPAKVRRRRETFFVVHAMAGAPVVLRANGWMHRGFHGVC